MLKLPNIASSVVGSGGASVPVSPSRRALSISSATPIRITTTPATSLGRKTRMRCITKVSRISTNPVTTTAALAALKLPPVAATST